ncbi:MAG: metalloregulator ArsR/SmtB family transcription factor [Trueperella sp.]|uniref:ArsR/SmtB family transcription factor n=1 Tax=Trueperella sp. TaxID=2699835 RepID=UPI002A90B179|nr:metalloregulator ArsR/SmtB family transcription factor [Trueperella sp.]MDY5402892.1 metalloregulator ArsR/SmtB family transcription factor [Trueperella sp.]
MTISSPPLDHGATAVYATLFHSLSDPTRLAVLHHLSYGEHRVRDLVEHLDLAQSTVSKHLSCLLECGLIVFRVEGRASWYRLADADDLAALLQAAEHLLAATGSQVTLCSQLMHPSEA